MFSEILTKLSGFHIRITYKSIQKLRFRDFLAQTVPEFRFSARFRSNPPVLESTKICSALFSMENIFRWTGIKNCPKRASNFSTSTYFMKLLWKSTKYEKFYKPKLLELRIMSVTFFCCLLHFFYVNYIFCLSFPALVWGYGPGPKGAV